MGILRGSAGALSEAQAAGLPDPPTAVAASPLTAPVTGGFYQERTDAGG